MTFFSLSCKICGSDTFEIILVKADPNYIYTFLPYQKSYITPPWFQVIYATKLLLKRVPQRTNCDVLSKSIVFSKNQLEIRNNMLNNRKIKDEIKFIDPISQNKLNLSYLSVKFYQMIKTRFPTIKKCPIYRDKIVQLECWRHSVWLPSKVIVLSRMASTFLLVGCNY